MINKMVMARDFSEEERTEISNYILANVPFSILQRLFPLTENPDEKPEIFTIMFRLINTAKNLVTKEETKIKLVNLLKENEEAYSLLYNLLIDSRKSYDFMKHRAKNKVRNILKNKEYSIKMNNLIDIFLIFAEKHELLDLNKITGLDLETPEGREVYKDLISDSNKNISTLE